MAAQSTGRRAHESTADEWLATFEALDVAAMSLVPGSANPLRASTACARLLGSAWERDAWLDRIHPADRPELERSLRAQQPTRVAFRWSDGMSFRAIELELRCFDEFSFAILNERLGDQGSHAPELEALLEALPFDVWQRDAQGVLIRQNAQALRNWGAQLGCSVEDMGLGPDLTKLWKELNARAFRGEVVSMPMDYEVGGRTVNYVNVIAPVREGGEIRGVVGVNIDITATRSAEAELARAQAQLGQRERLAALGELAAVVAHEVRNPLGSIFNSLSSLRKQLTLTGDAAVLFAILEEEAERLNRTVGDLLNFVRPLAPDRRAEDLVRLARDALQHGLRTLRINRAPIASEVLVGDASETFEVDPNLLRIALTNLVSNAVQAMPDGGKVTITIGATRNLGMPDGIAISVSDTGRGISPAVLERVFEPFFTTRASGTGLGLAVVRRIVEAHKGSVAAVSDHNGTSFTLLLPR